MKFINCKSITSYRFGFFYSILAKGCLLGILNVNFVVAQTKPATTPIRSNNAAKPSTTPAATSSKTLKQAANAPKTKPALTTAAPKKPSALPKATSTNAAPTVPTSPQAPKNIANATPPKPFVNRDSSLVRLKNITGNLSPKSVVHNGNGLFFAQNMMYNHTVSVYNRDFGLVKTIKDQVKLADYGIADAEGVYKGAPVEVAFSHNGRYAWVSNYRMYGKGFTEELGDDCPMSNKYQGSYVYGINTETFAIEYVIGVGSVPKYVAVTPDNRYILVSNWCSGDLSIIDLNSHTEIKRVTLGAHPRGIVVDAQSRYAYIAIMGGSSIAVLDLRDFSLSRIAKVGITPRHLCLSPDGRYLYATFNNEGKVGKIDLTTRTLVAKVRSGKAPRSMVLSADGAYLYVVNYNDANISKIQTSDMAVWQKIKSPLHPIGITIDDLYNRIWVACYSGSIAVYHDRRIGQPLADTAPIAAKTADLPPKTANIAKPKNQNTAPTVVDKPQPVRNAATKTVNSALPEKTAYIAPKTPQVRESDSFLSRVSHTIWSFLSPPPALATPAKSYNIIIASFNEENKYKIADFMQKASDKGLKPELINEQQLGRYRLVCGKYAQRSDAEKALSDIRCYYPDAWILW
jgi:YVTN family beta-propeller protein